MVQTYYSDVNGCFIWNLQEMLQGRIDGTSWICTTETSRRRTNKSSFGVSFENCLRPREDLLMRCRCYVLLRHRHYVPIRCRGDVTVGRLGDFPSRRGWVFHLRRTCNVAGMYREALCSYMMN